MDGLIGLTVILCAGAALFGAAKSLERAFRRPGLALTLGAAVMILGGAATMLTGRSWFAVLFFMQGAIFAYEGWRRRRMPSE